MNILAMPAQRRTTVLPNLSAVWAQTYDGAMGIGDGSAGLPWGKHAAELEHFYAQVEGTILVAGSTTMDTLPPRARLGRRFIRLTSQPGKADIGHLDVQGAVERMRQDAHERFTLIGGRRALIALLPYCSMATVSHIGVKTTKAMLRAGVVMAPPVGRDWDYDHVSMENIRQGFYVKTYVRDTNNL